MQYSGSVRMKFTNRGKYCLWSFQWHSIEFPLLWVRDFHRALNSHLENFHPHHLTCLAICNNYWEQQLLWAKLFDLGDFWSSQDESMRSSVRFHKVSKLASQKASVSVQACRSPVWHVILWTQWCTYTALKAQSQFNSIHLLPRTKMSPVSFLQRSQECR